MAGKEGEPTAREGRWLINFTKAEMLAGVGLVGVGITLIPGLGSIGAIAFIAGAGEYLIIQYAKRQGEKKKD